MKIYNWSAPRMYGFISNVLLTVAWVTMTIFLGWCVMTNCLIPSIVFGISLIALISSVIITIALSTAVPAYWEDLDRLTELQEDARLARLKYEKAQDILIKTILKEDYPTEEPFDVL